MTSKIERRGGRRSNAGRKPMGDKARVTLSVRVKPETLRYIVQRAAADGISKGELIDGAFGF